MNTHLPTHTWGTGPTRVLMLHGFTGSRHSFDHLASLVGDEITATCVELPGHGTAPLVESFELLLETLAPLAQTADVVFGYSLGARLSLALALRYPHLVKALILESGTAGLHRRHQRVQRRVADERLARWGEAHGLEAFMNHWQSLPLFNGLSRLNESQRRALSEIRGSHSMEGLAHSLRTVGQGSQPDLWPVLPSLRVPTLLLTGAEDQKFTRIAHRMAEQLPRCWHAEIAEAGHVVHREQPAAWAREVLGFCRAIQTAQSTLEPHLEAP